MGAIDKLVRSNIDESILGFAPDLLGIEEGNLKPLPTVSIKYQEKRMDAVWRVTEDRGDGGTINEFILHVEVQTQDDRNMVHRMREYHSLLVHRYQLPVRQVVIHLSPKPSKMLSQVPLGQVYQGFQLLELSKVPLENLLETGRPEAMIYAILGDFGGKCKEKGLSEILSSLKLSKNGGENNKKILQKLYKLATLVNLEVPLLKVIERMYLEIDIEQTVLFRRGLEKGIQKGKLAGKAEAMYLLHLTRATPPEELATMFSFPLDEVKEILANQGQINP